MKKFAQSWQKVEYNGDAICYLIYCKKTQSTKLYICQYSIVLVQVLGLSNKRELW